MCLPVWISVNKGRVKKMRTIGDTHNKINGFLLDDLFYCLQTLGKTYAPIFVATLVLIDTQVDDVDRRTAGRALNVLSVMFESNDECISYLRLGHDHKLKRTSENIKTNDSEIRVKTRIKEQVFPGFRLILFLYIGCFLQSQPDNILQVFLKLFL